MERECVCVKERKIERESVLASSMWYMVASAYTNIDMT